MKYVGFFIELAIFAVLLYIVWHTAHWSVSLTLTLVVFIQEVKGSSWIPRKEIHKGP